MLKKMHVGRLDYKLRVDFCWRVVFHTLCVMFSFTGCSNNSRLLSYFFSGQSKLCLRRINLLGRTSTKAVILNKSKHKIIYDFHYIKYLGAFIRVKHSVPKISVVIAPVLYYLDDTKVSPFILLLSAGCFFLFGQFLSKLCKNTVGKMYVIKEGEVKDVLISSIDASGTRIDRIHNLDDIINLDYPNKMARIVGFIQLAVDKSDVYYNLNLHSCKFIDEKLVDYILGARWDLYSTKRNEIESSKKQ